MSATSLISADNSWALFAILTAIAAIAIFMEQKWTWASKISGCVIALIGAMILSNLKIIPLDAPAYDFVWDYIVPAAIPLLLFKANLKKIGKDSGRTLIIYLLSGLGTIAGGFLAYYALRNSIPGLVKITPMMVGSYVGGSANLVAMADAFGATGDTVSIAVVADNLLMAIYFFVLAAMPVMGFFRKHFRHPIVDQIEAEEAASGAKNRAEAFWAPKNISLKDIAGSVGTSLVIVAVSTAIANFFDGIIPETNFFMTLINGLLGSNYLIMTTITVCLATFLPNFIGELAGAQEIGTFLIHIFFAVIGVPASIMMIMTQAPLLLVFCLIIVAVNMLFSLVFGKIFKFGLEEIIIASNANIGGPTTAAAMAISKGWVELVTPAILVGTLGYVIGNYYGIFIGTFLGAGGL